MLQITPPGKLPPDATPALSVVIPVYNGAATIGELVAGLSGLDVAGGIEIVLVAYERELKIKIITVWRAREGRNR